MNTSRILKSSLGTLSKGAGKALASVLPGASQALLAITIARRLGSMIVGPPGEDPFDPVKRMRL